MNVKIEGIEFPAYFIKNIILKDKKITITLLDDNDMEFTFKDEESSKTTYEKIIRKLK